MSAKTRAKVLTILKSPGNATERPIGFLVSLRLSAKGLYHQVNDLNAFVRFPVCFRNSAFSETDVADNRVPGRNRPSGKTHLLRTEDRGFIFGTFFAKDLTRTVSISQPVSSARYAQSVVIVDDLSPGSHPAKERVLCQIGRRPKAP